MRKGRDLAKTDTILMRYDRVDIHLLYNLASEGDTYFKTFKTGVDRDFSQRMANPCGSLETRSIDAFWKDKGIEQKCRQTHLEEGLSSL